MLIRRSGRRAWPAAVLAFAGWAALAPAQEEIVVRAHYGFGDAVPEAGPCPLTLEIENRGTEAVRLAIGVRETELVAVSAPFIGRRVEVSPGAGRLVTLLVPADAEGNLTLEVASDPRKPIALGAGGGKAHRSGDRDAVRLQLGAEPEPRKVKNGVLVLGGQARQLAGALDPRLLPEGADRDGVLMIDGAVEPLCTLDARAAPDTWLAYSGLATILWTAPDLAELPDPAQLRALREWVQSGGRLVILAAGRPEVFAAGALADLWPVAPRAETIAYPCPEGIEASTWERSGFVFDAASERGTTRIGTASGGWLGRIPMARAERFLGEGTVVLAGFDPLAYDLGRPRLLVSALEAAAGLTITWRERPDRDSSEVRSLTGYGGAAFWNLLLNHNVLRPPLGLFLLLGLVFVLMIGPIDYAVLKRLGKMTWSPVTLLVYTALFSGLCVGATYFIFAPKREVNRVALLHFIETPSGEEWVHGWLYHGIYTPTGATFRPAPEGFDCFGITVSGEAVGPGMPRSYRAFAADPQVWLGSGRQPLDLDLGFNAFRAAAARIGGRPEGGIGTAVKPGGGPAWIDITVHNGLERPLRNVVIIARDLFVRIPDIPASQEARREAVRTPGVVHDFRNAGYLASHDESRRISKDEDMPVSMAEDLCAATSKPGTSDDHWILPGDLRGALAAGRAVLMATISDTPFADPVAGSAKGFTFVHIRKVFDLDPE